MRRLACAALIAAGCQDIYPMFMGSPGDGGATSTSNTSGIGGMLTPDLSTTPLVDGGVPGTALILMHSSVPSFVSADFRTSQCKRSQVSGCTLTDCTSNDMAVSPPSVGVGVITVTAPQNTLTLTPLADGSYATQQVAGRLWSANGASLTVAATGSAVFPAFDVMVEGPALITVTTPLAGALDVPRNADLDVAWADGTTGQVTVELEAGPKTLSCSFALAASTGKLPFLGLMQLPAGNAILSIRVTRIVVVDTSIELRAEVDAEDANGAPFTAAVNLR